MEEMKLKIAKKLGISYEDLSIYNIENINNFYVVSCKDDMTLTKVAFICDKDGKQCTETSEVYYYCEPQKPIPLNDTNFLTDFDGKVNHYRIQEDELHLISSFENSHGLIYYPKHYINNGLVGIGNSLYNFETGQVINKNFDAYIHAEWRFFSSYWGFYAYDDYLEQFQSMLMEKEIQNNIFGVIKKVSVEQYGQTESYETLVFLHKDGTFASNLYYVDKGILKVVEGVTSKNLDETIEKLKSQLWQKINAPSTDIPEFMENPFSYMTEKIRTDKVTVMEDSKFKIANKLGVPSDKIDVYNINNFYEVSYRNDSNRYVLIVDQDGNPCTETFKIPWWKDVPQPVLLNDKDFLLVLDNTVNHYRIEQGECNLVNSFYDPSGFVNNSNYYVSQGIVGIDDLLYNFKTDQVINKHFDCYINEAWDDLGCNWGISEEYLEQFQSIMTKKALQNHMFGVTKVISVEQDDITLSYEILMFVNKDGQFVSNLYYVDDMSLVVVEGVTLENFDETIEQLKSKLMKKINILVAKKKEEQEKHNQMSLIIQKNLESIL